MSDLLAGYDTLCHFGWDGYGAMPITAQTIATARRAMRLFPSAWGDVHPAPGGDGSIGFEFSACPHWVDVKGRRVSTYRRARAALSPTPKTKK